MAEERGAPNWKGPVAAAIILLGGYVAYQQWREHHQQEQQCADLKRAFTTNMDSLIGSSSFDEAIKEKSELPLLGIAGGVAANQAVLDTLNVKCPGWMEKQYD